MPPVTACSYCGARMTASATFCAHCGQEVPGAREPLLLEPPPKPNFTDRVTLQGNNALRLLIVLLASLFGSAIFVGLFFDDTASGMLFASVMLAIGTTLCALPEGKEIRMLFDPAAVGRLRPWLWAAVVTPLLPLAAMLWLTLIGMQDEAGGDAFGMSTWMAVLTICLFPGIFEELAFRGVVFGNLRHMLTPRWAQVVTAALFAAVHFAPVIFPYHFLVGYFLGWLRVRGGNLVVPMFAHALHNAVVVFVYDAS